MWRAVMKSADGSEKTDARATPMNSYLKGCYINSIDRCLE